MTLRRYTGRAMHAKLTTARMREDTLNTGQGTAVLRNHVRYLQDAIQTRESLLALTQTARARRRTGFLIQRPRRRAP